MEIKMNSNMNGLLMMVVKRVKMRMKSYLRIPFMRLMRIKRLDLRKHSNNMKM